MLLIMKEYQSDGNIVASVNDFGRTSLARRIAETASSSTAAVAAATPLSTGRVAPGELVDNFDFAFRSESHQSLLTTSSLSLSHSSFDYWPEFQQNYHSIMDNTNLLDSCAAALSDITCDDDDSSGGSSSAAAHRQNILFDSSLLSSAASSVSFCGTNPSKSISTGDVERFSRWLFEMEARVADQPTLSQIFAMSSDEMAIQLKVHSKLFNDIVAQPCIVNGSKRKEHKLIEERYHLLYLKAYEVQLLLEGLPGNNIDDRTSANKILNKSFYDFDKEFNHVTENDAADVVVTMNGSDNCDAINAMDNDDENNGMQSQREQTSDNNSSRLFTQTNRATSNVGMFYFKYEQTNACDQQQPLQPQQPWTVLHDSVDDGENNTTVVNSAPIDTELSFTTLYDNEMRSYLNESDTIYNIDSPEYVSHPIDKSKSSILQPNFLEDTMRFSQNTRMWNDLDFSLATRDKSTIDQIGSDTESHSKVRNWLLNRTDSTDRKFMSSLSLDRICGDDDYRMLYRSRSELNLRSRQKSMGSLHSSSNGPATDGLKSIDSASASSLANCSLDWDFYQNVYGAQQESDKDSYFDDEYNDEMSEMAKNLCYFGNDYSLYLTSSTISLNTVGDIKAEQYAESITEEKTTGDSATTAELVVGEEEIKRQKRLRRQRKKRAKKRQQQQLQRLLVDSNSVVSSETASTGNTSMTSSDSCHFESFVQASNEKETSTPSAPPKTIKYDSSANKFEVYSDELGESKLLKVSELRPEDFHDVISMCQNNIDCVITVLGAKPNQVLTVAYCRYMKNVRNKCESDSVSTCECTTESKKSKNEKKSSSKKNGCQCNDSTDQSTCICLWVEQTIAMILNFLMDCWNIFRNMKLYTYLCRVLKSLFSSTRYVADHLKMRSELTKLNALKYL